MIEPLRILQTNPQLTASIAIRVPREEIRHVMGPGLAELKAAVAAQNIAVTGPWFTHHFRNPGEVFDFEICLPVAAPVAPAGRMQPGQWPAMTIAQTTYHGGFKVSATPGASSSAPSRRPDTPPLTAFMNPMRSVRRRAPIPRRGAPCSASN